jgi:DNA-binding NarL/FixJ family response regulator
MPPRRPIRLILAIGKTLYRESIDALLVADKHEKKDDPEMEVLLSTADCDSLVHVCSGMSFDVLIIDESFVLAGDRTIAAIAAIAVEQSGITGIVQILESQDPRVLKPHQLQVCTLITVSSYGNGSGLKQAICRAATTQGCEMPPGAPLPLRWTARSHNVDSSDHTVSITAREQEILDLITQGLSNKEIASRLGIQTHTVKNHVSKMLTKLRVEDRVQLAVYNIGQTKSTSSPSA